MNRRRFLKTASGLVVAGAAGYTGGRSARADGYLPALAADGGTAPINVDPGTITPVIEETGEGITLGGKIIRDRAWFFASTRIENTTWNRVRLDGVVTSDAADLGDAYFLGRTLDSSGNVTSAHLTPLSLGLPRPFVTGGNQFHYNGFYDLPSGHENDDFEGYLITDLERANAKLNAQLTPGNSLVLQADKRVIVQGRSRARFLWWGEEEAALTGLLDFGNKGSGSPFVGLIDSGEELTLPNIPDGANDFSFQYRELSFLANPSLTATDVQHIQGVTRVFARLDTNQVITDVVPTLSFFGGTPINGTPILATFYPFNTTPLIFNLPGSVPPGLELADVDLGIASYKLASAVNDPRVLIVPERPIFWDDGAGLEAITAVENPYGFAVNTPGMQVDQWLTEYAADGTYIGPAGLTSHTLPNAWPPFGRSRFRRPVQDFTPYLVDGPNVLESSWDELTTDPLQSSQGVRRAMAHAIDTAALVRRS